MSIQKETTPYKKGVVGQEMLSPVGLQLFIFRYFQK